MDSEHPGAALFEQHHLVIFRYFWRMTSRREIAEDLTQDVFVRAVRGLAGYEPRNRDRAWLFQIARRLLLDHRRTARRRGTAAELTDRDAAAPPVQQLSLAIDEALDRLSEVDREVFVLREVAGLGYEEIATVCGLTPAAVRSRICRARAALRTALQPVSPHLV